MDFSCLTTSVSSSQHQAITKKDICATVWVDKQDNSMEEREKMKGSALRGEGWEGGGSFAMQGGGKPERWLCWWAEVNCANIHLLLDRILSAWVLTLLNTTGRPPLWRCAGLQPCVNEVNIPWPHAWPNVDPSVTLEITLSVAKSQSAPFLVVTKSLTDHMLLFVWEWGMFTRILFMQCNAGSQIWTGRSDFFSFPCWLEIAGWSSLHL